MVRLFKDLFELVAPYGEETGSEKVYSKSARARTALYQAKPKLEPSCPLATIVN
jgi:hypothetical protein